MSIADDDSFCYLLDKYTDAVCEVRIDNNMKNLVKGVFAAQEFMEYVDKLIDRKKDDDEEPLNGLVDCYIL